MRRGQDTNPGFLTPRRVLSVPTVKRDWEGFSYELGKITSVLDGPESGDKPAPRPSTPSIPPLPSPTTTMGWL